MRSRFSAFATGNLDYLKSTWHADFCPQNLTLDSRLKWLTLQVLDFIDGESSAEVEFEASFLARGSVNGMHERSRFVCQQERWLYTAGDELPPTFKRWKPSRNDNCPCGSGKKFKRCCA